MTTRLPLSPRPSCRWTFLLVFVVFVAGILTTPALAAHSRRRVTAVARAEDKYDRSITTFDKTGRLLQVEYGMTAAARGSPIVAVLANNNNINHNSDNDSSPPSSMMIYVLVSNSAGQVYRIDDHLFMFATGLMGDARALANRLRVLAQRHAINMGEPCTVREMAQYAANAQHELTRMGGVRPLGCTAIIAGVDPSSSMSSMPSSSTPSHGAATAGVGDVRIFRTNPGGILEDCCYCAAGRNHEDVMNQLSKQYNSKNDALLSSTASRSDQVHNLLSMAKKAISGDADTKNWKNVMDVWMIEPCPWRRGKTKAVCLRNLREDTLGQLDQL